MKNGETRFVNLQIITSHKNSTISKIFIILSIFLACTINAAAVVVSLAKILLLLIKYEKKMKIIEEEEQEDLRYKHIKKKEYNFGAQISL